jgi:hypothetical protein
MSICVGSISRTAGGGVGATYDIEPVLAYDLDVFFIPAKGGQAGQSSFSPVRLMDEVRLY